MTKDVDFFIAGKYIIKTEGPKLNKSHRFWIKLL